MKLNDIFTNLPKKINLKKEDNKKTLKPKQALREENNIDELGFFDLGKIDIRSRQKIKASKNKTPIFDSATKKGKLSKKLDLKEKILKQTSFFHRILGNNFFKILQIKYRILKEKNLLTKISILLSLIFLLILGDKILVENLVKSGFNNLENIKTAQSYKELRANIKNAKSDFFLAKIFFSPFLLIPNSKVQNANIAINIGKEISSLSLNLLYQAEDLQKQIKFKDIKNILFSELLESKKIVLEDTQKSLEEILQNIEKINLDKTDPNYKKIESFKEKLVLLRNNLDYINNNFKDLLALLGHNKAKKYLIVFQNNDEIRASGGFIGSAGIVEIFRGNIKSFIKKDIYALEWDINKIYKEKLAPPKGIDKITNNFGLRDSNYFIDFGKSANAINFFMEKGPYKGIDGVVFINMNPVLEILDKIGGVYFEKIDKTIDSSNFSEIMSILVEAKSYKSGTLGTPKQILFDFMEELKNKLEKNIASLVPVIVKEIKNREIVVKSFNKKEDRILEKLGLNGQIDYSRSLDFSYPVFTSIGGNKTDRYIERTYKKNIEIQKDCSIITNLKITLKHNYSQETENRIKGYLKEYNIEENKDLLNIQGAGVNKSFVRVLIPKQAKIKSYSNATIQSFDDFNYIDFYITTTPQKTSSYEFKYKIENPDCRDYSFILYKQPGIKNYNLKIINSKEEYIFQNIDSDFKYKK